MNKLNKDFLNLTKTKDDLILLEDAIDQVYDALYTKSFKAKLRKIVSKELLDVFEKNFSKMNWKLESIKNYLEDIKSQIASVQTIEFTLAFKPSEAFLDILYKWALSNLGENVILDIIIDPSIVAGVKIAYKGRLKDYSFKNLLKSSMEKERGRILACLA